MICHEFVFMTDICLLYLIVLGDVYCGAGWGFQRYLFGASELFKVYYIVR